MNGTGEVALRVEGLSRSIAGQPIVDDVGFEVRRGEVLTLVGPSGCGKSSLLRLIAGLDVADAGRVLLGGDDVSGVPPERRHIGFVFQESSLFGHLRVAQNVAFGLRDLPRAERTERVAEMLDLVHLGHLARRYPHQLSGGEQQRVALARALAPRPRVVLLDEPFASLDEVLREELGHQVVGILRATETAAVLVTHDRHEAMTLGDRVAVMRGGRLQQCDTPEEVYRRPASRFVAGFVEVASFLDGDDETVLVARPHDLEVLPEGDDVVTRVEFLGGSYRYTVRRVDGRELVVDGAVTGEGPTAGAAGRRLDVGDRCTVRLRTEHLHRLR